MILQTKIPRNKPSDNPIDYKSKVLLLGSCFVENIGDKLEYFKFQNLQNPFGILFNPKAIERFVTNAVDEKSYVDKDIFFHNEQWHCFDAHSVLSSPVKEDLLSNLNRQIRFTKEYISQATHVILTLGTSWVYYSSDKNDYVANCHKVPQRKFDKELMSIETITESLEVILGRIKRINNETQVIFTVSPVRHIKDGFIENMRSKAHLISAIHGLLDKQSMIKNDLLHYFPSYEIMMDELRDYRFYKEDMIHPNRTAIDYIWEAFKNVWISRKIFSAMNEVDTIQKGMLHQPFNPNSEAHGKFQQQLEIKKASIQKQFPHISF